MFLFFLLSGFSALNALYASQSVAAVLEKSQKMDDSKAIAFLLRALEDHHHNDKLYYRIGFLYHKMNRRSEALEYYKLALQSNPCHARALNNSGNLYLDKGLPKMAFNNYNKALECNPKLFSVHYNLGNFFRKQDKNEDAILHYKAALKLYPDHNKSHHNLGLVYLDMLKKSMQQTHVVSVELSGKVREHFSKAIGIDKKDVYSWYNRGRYYQLIGDNKNANRDYKRALYLLPSGSRFRNILYRKIQQTR